MKVYVQWATDPPQGWELIDSKDWSKLPKKKEPTRDREPIYDENNNVIDFNGTPETIDSTKGWISQICIQGLTDSADHIAIIDEVDYVKLIGWKDDPVDYTPEEFNASEWKLYPVGNNTKQFLTRYLHPNKIIELEQNKQLPITTTSGTAIIKNFSEFVKPPTKYIRHGIWLLQSQIDSLTKLAQPKSFEEWRE